jgi:hypothetical protein
MFNPLNPVLMTFLTGFYDKIERLFAQFDHKRNGVIDLDDFILGLSIAR